MVVNLIAQTMYFVGYQIPLFLLVFGMSYLALGFAVKPLNATLALPIAALSISASLAWFVMFGGLTLMSNEVFAVLGIGLVMLVLGRVFAGA
ncbi:MAG: hypothetical protein R6U26_01850 [Candidatus Undinarchaeales archaeon]